MDVICEAAACAVLTERSVCSCGFEVRAKSFVVRAA